MSCDHIYMETRLYFSKRMSTDSKELRMILYPKNTNSYSIKEHDYRTEVFLQSLSTCSKIEMITINVLFFYENKNIDRMWYSYRQTDACEPAFNP